MDSVFGKEDEVVAAAEKLLASNIFTTDNDKTLYTKLLEEYKMLLEQMKRVVKMSDKIELQLVSQTHSNEELSKVDFLTSIYNRRSFDDLLNREWKSCSRNRSSLSVIMIDIDKFKSYNDTYGHLQGDKCLQSVACTIKSTISRARDSVSRYGGDEFVVLVPETNSNGARHIAENIRKNVEHLGMPNEFSKPYGKVTISVGVSTMIPDRNHMPEYLVNLADAFLYKAKESGGNRVNS